MGGWAKWIIWLALVAGAVIALFVVDGLAGLGLLALIMLPFLLFYGLGIVIQVVLGQRGLPIYVPWVIGIAACLGWLAAFTHSADRVLTGLISLALSAWFIASLVEAGAESVLAFRAGRRGEA